jgi:peptide/nickel transport system permease protein
MLRFVYQRLIRALLILVVGTFLAYAMLRLIPGDPTLAKLGQTADKASRDALKHKWHLDGNIVSGYWAWAKDAIRGKLGSDFAANIPVTTRIRQTLTASVQLMVYAQILSLVGAFVVGSVQAYKRDSAFDKAMNSWTSFLISTPVFVLGLVLQIIIAVQLKWVRPTGLVPFGESPWEHFKTALLPAVTLAALPFATYCRLLRTDMIATLQEDYILLARSKGLKPSYILRRHGLKPSLFSLVTSAGLNIGALLGGAVAVEGTFNINGVGNLIVKSVLAREFLVVQGTLVLIIMVFVLSNLAVEVLYGVLDPRVRHARAVA